MTDDLFLLKRIKNNDIGAFEKLFRLYYAPLCRYADSFVNDLPVAEELVQDLFYFLWKGREEIEIKLSFSAYLYRATRNRAWHYLKHRQIHEAYKATVTEQADEQHTIAPDEALEYKELENQLAKSLDRLSERQRRIFCMNRYEGKKYTEIACELSVSIKTVEADMSKVLSTLRKDLRPFTHHTQLN
jgi:RNA polymerase sigma-70 factor (ECF subfamily)